MLPAYSFKERNVKTLSFSELGLDQGVELVEVTNHNELVRHKDRSKS